METGLLEGYAYRYVPAGGAGDAPTLLLLHGTGGDENDLISLGRLLHPEAALLSPRGNAPENGMARFFRRHAEGVFDQEDLRTRTEGLGRFVVEATRLYALDPARIVAIGYSNGANIGASLLLRHAGLLRGAVLLHAMQPFVPERLPDLANTPVFLSAGRNDPIVPARSAQDLASLLQSAGAPVTLRWFDAGHALTGEEAEAARDWIAQRSF